METDKQSKEVSLDEISSAFSPDRVFSLGDDLVLIDDFTAQDLVETPFQAGFLVFGFCRRGEAVMRIGEKEFTARPGNLLLSLGGQTFREVHRSNDFRATVVLMSRSFSQDCIVGLNYMWPYLLYVLSHPVVELDPSEQRWIAECYSLLYRRMHNPRGRYLRETIIALARAFYFEICGLLDNHAHPDLGASHKRAYTIFDDFIRCVSQHFREQRTVEWYSQQLCLTSKHLSEVVKAVSGRTAGQWISTLVIIEIKTLLQDSSLSIKEIAQEMHFPNQSFLGKYFKNVEGISPSDFRKRFG